MFAFKSGRLLEEVAFGRCRPTPREYLPWRQAAALAAAAQPPVKARLAARLERAVREQVGAAVVFYTAVGTPFDFFHGVDGFLLAAGGIVVTLDLTRNPHKDCGKADLIVREDDLDDLPELAGRIARELRSRLARSSNCFRADGSRRRAAA